MSTIAYKSALLALFHERVRAKQFEGAKRIALTLGMVSRIPQEIFEQDDAYMIRLSRLHRPKRERQRAA